MDLYENLSVDFIKIYWQFERWKCLISKEKRIKFSSHMVCILEFLFFPLLIQHSFLGYPVYSNNVFNVFSVILNALFLLICNSTSE